MGGLSCPPHKKLILCGTGILPVLENGARCKMNEFYATAIDADAISRAIACAIKQPGDFDVNEIIIGLTPQEL